jgi:hypothetical protein
MLNIIVGIVAWFVAFSIVIMFFSDVENNYQTANNNLNNLKKAADFASDQTAPDPSEELQNAIKEVEKWGRMRPAVLTGLVTIIAIPVATIASFVRGNS